MVQIDQSCPQQWSELFTAAYRGLPPPTRWSTQIANGKYKDHRVGLLTIWWSYCNPAENDKPTWRRLLWYDGCVGFLLKYWVVVVQVSHLCKYNHDDIDNDDEGNLTCTLRVAEELSLASVCSSVATTSKMKFCSFGFSKSSFCNVKGIWNSWNNSKIKIVWIFKVQLLQRNRR